MVNTPFTYIFIYVYRHRSFVAVEEDRYLLSSLRARPYRQHHYIYIFLPQQQHTTLYIHRMTIFIEYERIKRHYI